MTPNEGTVSGDTMWGTYSSPFVRQRYWHLESKQAIGRIT